MMYAHVCSNNEIDKRINVSKTANNIGTMVITVPQRYAVLWLV